VTEDIGKLQILYNNENVLSSDTTLKIVTIKLINSGNISITKEMYDEDYLLGIKVENCKIADKPTIIDFSNSYIKERFSFNQENQTIKINPIIFDNKDYVTLKLLLIGEKGKQVRISAFGKISGQKSIPILTEIDEQNKISFWSRLVEGSIWIHITRFFLYTFGFGFGTLLIIMPISLIFDNISKKSDLKKIERYKVLNDLKQDNHYELIFNFYLNSGISLLNKILSLSNDPVKLEKYVNVDFHAKGLTYRDLSYLNFPIEMKSDSSEIYNWKTFIDEMWLEKDVLQKEGGKTKLNEDFVIKLNRFINYLNV